MSLICRTVSLCSTCMKSSRCTIQAARSRPVFECDEYLKGRFTVAEEWVPQSDPADDVAGRLEGLCETCQNQSDCFARALVQTVWQCEEYC